VIIEQADMANTGEYGRTIDLPESLVEVKGADSPRTKMSWTKCTGEYIVSLQMVFSIDARAH
jgi:hypothetical protein